MKELIMLFLASALVNNFILARFLGICPFLGVTNQMGSALSMGGAVTGVMFATSIVTWMIYNWILVPLDLVFLQYVVYILVIASMVQVLEQFIRVKAPKLHKSFGVYLPLITTNCAILGLALLISQGGYDFISSVVFALGGGAGFTLAMVIMAGLREEFRQNQIPKSFRGTGIGLVTAGILAMAFLGFGGMM